MRVLFVSIFVILADQVSKLLVKGFAIPFLNFRYEGMYHGQRIPVLGDFFRLTFIENPGMAFGYDPGSDFKLWISIFSLVASLALLGYLYYMREHHLSMRIGLAFILGGAVGNMIDRIFYGIFYGYAPLFYGKVVDFFDFDFFNVNIFGRSYDRFPVFNVADAAVTIGVLIMIIFYRKHKTVEVEPAAATETFDGGRPLIGDSGTVEGIKDSDDDEPDKGKEIPI